MTGARYTTLPASFWQADPATAGLSPLAACIFLRAKSDSLVGVLRLSPRAIATAHAGVTAAAVETAMAELVDRGLVGWWPDLDVVAIVGGALEAKGKAVVAADRELAALPPQVAEIARRHPPSHPPSDGASRQHKQEHEHKHSDPQEQASISDRDGDQPNLEGGTSGQLQPSPAEPGSAIAVVERVNGEQPPAEVASLPLRLIPEVDPDPKGWRRRQARRLWDWHEAERVGRLHGGHGVKRAALDEDLDRVVGLVRKVAKQESLDERAAFARVHEFRRRAIEQARIALAGDDAAWGRKLVAYCRNDSAWSIKAYGVIMGEAPDVSSSSVQPPGTIDGDPLSRVEVVAWRDAFAATGDTGLARMAVVSLRRSPNEPRDVIDVSSPPAKVHNPFAIGGAK